MLRRFRRDEKGATAVELALVLPVLFIILISMIDLSIAMFLNTVVEGSLKDASRIGLTGVDTGEISHAESIVNIINGNSAGLINATAGDVSSLVYPSFAEIGMPEPYVDADGDGQYTAGESYTDVNGNGAWDEDMGEAGLGGPGEIVLYTLEYDWNLLSGELLPILNGIIPMSATMVVRNEPF